MAAGNRRIVQEDFSAGAFVGTSYEQIPSNGVYNAVNYLVDEDRSLKARGGSRWAAPAFGTGVAPWMWSGVIGSTARTIVGSSSNLAAVNDLAGTSTAIAAATPGLGPGVSLAGLLFMPGGVTISSALAVGAAALVRSHYAVAGNRLWAAADGSTRVDFSDVGVPGTFGGTSFHQIPEGGIIGLMGLRDALVVFTTAGVWIISNVGMNLTDATGNVQHRIDRYSRMVLWSTNGLGAAYEGGLVVPARDGVYLLNYGVASEAPQQFTLISRPIGNWYRTYVNSGYTPGQPTVFRNTLFLPVIGSLGGYDLLVCRLDATDARGRLTFPWTRISGGAYPLTLARSVFTGNLLGGAAGFPRVATLDYFDPSLSTADADGTNYPKRMQTRSPVAPTNVATLARFRLGYELDGADVISALYNDREGGFVALTGTAADNSANLAPHTWRVGQRARYSSMQMDYLGAATSLILRSAEWFVRDRGRV